MTVLVMTPTRSTDSWEPVSCGRPFRRMITSWVRTGSNGLSLRSQRAACSRQSARRWRTARPSRPRALGPPLRPSGTSQHPRVRCGLTSARSTAHHLRTVWPSDSNMLRRLLILVVPGQVTEFLPDGTVVATMACPTSHVCVAVGSSAEETPKYDSTPHRAVVLDDY